MLSESSLQADLIDCSHHFSADFDWYRSLLFSDPEPLGVNVCHKHMLAFVVRMAYSVTMLATFIRY